LISVPFNGSGVFARARELNAVQIRSCGDFSLIDLSGGDGIKSNLSFAEMRQYSEYQHSIVRESLVEPTYDELMKWVSLDVAGHEETLANLREKIKDVPAGKERDAIVDEIESCKVLLKLVLPQDFMAAIMSFALKIDSSDIKKVTRDMLYRAAILASRGHDNPHDHVDGFFTPFNLEDIDIVAWGIYEEEKDRKKAG
jgi:hypothetical protein